MAVSVPGSRRLDECVAELPAAANRELEAL